MANKYYETLIMLTPVVSAKDLEKSLAAIKTVYAKYNAEAVKLDKWGDRKLAYKIRAHKRATYLFGYLNSPPESIDKIKKDCRLIPNIIRMILLSVEADALNRVVPSANADTAATA